MGRIDGGKSWASNAHMVFDEPVARAAEVRVMEFEEAGREAYEAANEARLGSADRLVAVWDGQMARSAVPAAWRSWRVSGGCGCGVA